MPAKYVRRYSKGQKNDFRDAEAIAEAVQRPTMKFVATRTAVIPRLMIRPVCPQLRKCHVCPGSYAWCHYPTFPSFVIL